MKNTTLAHITKMISDLSGLPPQIFQARPLGNDGDFEAVVQEASGRMAAAVGAQANLDEICRRLREHYRIN